MEPLFEALSTAAGMNPDPTEDPLGGDDDDLIYDADEVQAGAQQAAMLDKFDNMIAASHPEEVDGQFDNA